MNITRETTTRTIPALLLLTCLCLSVLGCSSAPLRCDDTMLTRNKIEKVALFSEGGVMWFGMIHERVIDVSESRIALESLHETTQAELEQRGYVVTASLPARVYTFNSQNVLDYGLSYDYHIPQTYSVYPNYKQDKENMLELSGDVTAYEAPELKENEALREALYRVFTDIEIASISHEVKQKEEEPRSPLSAKHIERVNQLSSFKPAHDDIVVIRDTVDADTLCFAKIYGRLNTRGYKNSPAAVAALINPLLSFGTFDNDAVLHICIDAATGDVLWQRFSRKTKPAFKEIITDLVQDNLDRFPEKGKPVRGECTL